MEEGVLLSHEVGSSRGSGSGPFCVQLVEISSGPEKCQLWSQSPVWKWPRWSIQKERLRPIVLLFCC